MASETQCRLISCKFLTLFTIFVFIFIAAFLSGCKNGTPNNSSTKAKPKKVSAVKVCRAVEGSISKSINLTGSVKATKIAIIGSPVEGPVTECNVREGDNVSAGGKLLTIGRKKAADAFVEAKKKALEREQKELDRVRKLVTNNAIAAEEMDVANMNVSRAKAELSRAMETVEDYLLKAPWDGLVSKVFVTDGYYVAPREHLIEIYDPKTLVVEFAVPETQALIICEGMSVDIKFDAYSGQPFTGKVTRLYPELDRQTRTRIAEAEVLKKTGITLLPGMFARINLVLEKIQNAVLVPERAVTSTPSGEQIVYIVDDHKVHSRRIKTGIEQDRRIQVIGNLRAGEMIVIEGNEKLKDGGAVKVIGSVAKSKTAESGGTK